MRSFIKLVRRSARKCLFASAFLVAPSVTAAPVIGSFTAQIIRIDGDDVAASPFFPDQALLTGAFGYDTDGAEDADPNPDRGLYTFDDTAFMSITVNGATYMTDPALSSIFVVLSIFPGNQNFSIRGGLVPEAKVALSTADVPLELTLVNGLLNSPFLPSDALPTSTFSLATFSDPDGIIGGAGATPYLVFFQLRSLSIRSVSAVPEPGALVLLGYGLLAPRWLRPRRANRRLSAARQLFGWAAGLCRSLPLIAPDFRLRSGCPRQLLNVRCGSTADPRQSRP